MYIDGIYVGVGLAHQYAYVVVCILLTLRISGHLTAPAAATARRTQVGLSHVPAGLRGVRVTLQQQDARAQDFVLQIKSVGFSRDIDLHNRRTHTQHTINRDEGNN